MATYFDKKKILKDNEDLYISEYDKGLHPNALSEIIKAKRDYAQAEKNNDEVGKMSANNRANSIRENYGSYNGGFDGSEYNKYSKGYEKRNKTFSSDYADDIKRAKRQLSEKEDFSYNPQSDPLYGLYKNLYLKLGNDAYDRALSHYALRTGGVASSSAQSIAMQERNRYNSMLSEKMPELYKIAYSKYNDEYERLFKKINTLSDLEDSQYRRFRDDMKDFESDRDYFYKKDKDRIDRINDNYEYESDFEKDIINDENDRQLKEKELNYKKEHDKTQDEISREGLNIRRAEMENRDENNKRNTAIRLATAIYGKVPISESVIQRIMSALD